MNPDQLVGLLSCIADQQVAIGQLRAENEALRSQLADLAQRLADAT